MGIKEDMPVLARHEGEWEGEYIHVTATGEIIDRHACHIQSTFPDDGEWPYFQINTYTWEDGRQEIIRFPATYRDGHIHFDTDRILGHAWEVDRRTVLLTWHYKTDPHNYLYEMIQISEDGNDRARTWHWYEDDQLVRRTLIKEKRIG